MLGKEGASNLIAWGDKGFSVPFCAFLKLEVKCFQCVAVRTTQGCCCLRGENTESPTEHSKLPGEGASNLFAWGRQRLFNAFCLLKLEVKCFQCVAVQSNSECLKLSKLNARQRRSQQPLCMGVAKVFQCLFVPFNTGSEVLPVRSGADKLGALTF
jgi:hypothetical protein